MFAAFALLGSSSIPRGTTVAGTAIGGLSEDQAKIALDQVQEARAKKKIKVSIDGTDTWVHPQDLGVTIDSEVTIDEAVGPRFSPSNVWRTWFGAGEQSPVLTINQETLGRWFASAHLAGVTPKVEPRIKYTGTTPEVVPGQAGKSISTEDLAVGIAKAMSEGSNQVELSAHVEEPSVSREQVDQFAQGTASQAVSAPIDLNIDNRSSTVSPEVIASSLQFKVQDGELKPEFDLGVFRKKMGKELADVDQRPVDAKWDVSSGTPVVVASVNGKGVPDDQLQSALGSAALGSGDQRKATLATEPLTPSMTTEQAQALDIKEKVSSFKQEFPYAEYRFQNIGQASKRVNNTLLMPDEIFSMNDIVGERTEERGFTKGPVVAEGGRLKEELGGGVSTATTAVWVAAFYGGLEKVEQGAHLIWIPRYQPGLEATVAWGQLDLKFKNNTGHPILITTDMKQTSVEVSIWGHKNFDSIKAVSGDKKNITNAPAQVDNSTNCVPQEGSPGFDIKVDRVIKTGGDKKVDSFFTHYIPAAPTKCVGG
ncbi:MAG: VanW family protein [Candidatus Nanopelagicales bacterium]